MKLWHKIVLAIIAVIAVFGFFQFQYYQLDNKVESEIGGRYYKFSDNSKRMDLMADKGTFTINWTTTNPKTQTIINYQYAGDVNATTLNTSKATKQEYQSTEPKDLIQAEKINFAISSYDKNTIKLHAQSGDDTKTYTLTSDGVVTVEQRKSNIVDWIISMFKNLWNRITDFIGSRS